MERTITLPETATINRAGARVEMDLQGLTPEIIAELALHGLTQKVGDAASGCKGNADEARGMMQKVIDALQAGNWGAKREGRATDPISTAAKALAMLEFAQYAPAKQKAGIKYVAEKYGLTTAQAKAKWIASIAERSDIRERAEAEAKASTDVDLGDIGL